MSLAAARSDKTNDQVTVDAAKAILVRRRMATARAAARQLAQRQRRQAAAVRRPQRRRRCRRRLPALTATPPLQECGVGIKCATITPDEARVKEFGLKKVRGTAEPLPPRCACMPAPSS